MVVVSAVVDDDAVADAVVVTVVFDLQFFWFRDQHLPFSEVFASKSRELKLELFIK